MKRFLPLAVIALLVLHRCFGANLNERQPGNRQGGTSIGAGEIAVAKEGHYFVVQHQGAVQLGDLNTRTVTGLPGLGMVDKIAFWPEGDGFFALEYGRATSGDEIEATLVSYDIGTRSVVWMSSLETGLYSLDVAPDGRHIVLHGLEVQILRATDGTVVGRFSPPSSLRDVDITNEQVLVTESTKWTGEDDAATPTTSVHVLNIETGAVTCTITAENCASELVVSQDATRAYIAPSSCQRDPVSVLDLTACKVAATLPGFGPIALARNDRLGVAFIDNSREDPLAPPLPEAVKKSNDRYHLMLFNTETLEYRTIALGARTPRYAVTPDEARLLLDLSIWSEDEDNKDANLRIVDIDEGTVRVVPAKEDTLLESYVFTHDSKSAWYNWLGGLFTIDLEAATVTKQTMNQSVSALNITPAGDALLLRVGKTLQLYDLKTGTITEIQAPSGS